MDFITITGLAYTIVGIVLRVFPPKKINILYGYRTKLSMANQSHWTFSQKHSGKLLIVMGLILAGIGAVLELFDINSPISIIVGLIMVIATAVLIFILTEKAIKKEFDITKKQ